MHQRTCKHCGTIFESARPNTRYCPACIGLCRNCGEPRNHNNPHLVHCHPCHARLLRERRAAQVKPKRPPKGPARPRPSNGGLSQAEAARRSGYTRQRINQLIRAGQLVTPITVEAVEGLRRRRPENHLSPEFRDSLSPERPA